MPAGEGANAAFAFRRGMPYRWPFFPGLRAMQTQNPLFDEMARLTTAAMGVAQSAGEEAKAAFRAQVDRMATEFDLVRRDEFEALKAEIAALRLEVGRLSLNAADPARATQEPG